ncbi:MAG: hypothetical protein ACFFCG_07345, partial [Promethearchaeota archaeon]
MGEKMYFKRNKIKVLFGLGVFILILFILPKIDFSFKPPNFVNESEIRCNPHNLNTSGYWELPSPIEIDDAGTNNWTWAEGEAWFGGGNGTQANPYIIENVTIDVNNNFEYCISIQNSNKHLIINNCTVSKANITGIFLENVNNSQIINNKVLNN